MSRHLKVAEEGRNARGGVLLRGRVLLRDGVAVLRATWELIRALPEILTGTLIDRLEKLARESRYAFSIEEIVADMVVSPDVSAAGQALYMSGRVKLMDERWGLYRVEGRSGMVRFVDLPIMYCDCPYRRHNPTSTHVCAHIYAALLHHMNTQPSETETRS